VRTNHLDQILKLKNLLEEITNSLNRLSLRNPRVRNLIESNMSGDLNNTPVRGTGATGGNVINPCQLPELVLGRALGLPRQPFILLRVDHFHMVCLQSVDSPILLVDRVHYSLTTRWEPVLVTFLIIHLKEIVYHSMHHCSGQVI